MRVKIDGSNRWLTKEREEIPVITMADYHLLAAVHMMERNRLEKITEAKRRLNFEKSNGVISVMFSDSLPIQGAVHPVTGEFVEVDDPNDAEDIERIITAVYSNMPRRYYELVAEGIHRGIIFRGPSEVERVIKVEEKIVNKIIYRNRKPNAKKTKRGKGRRAARS